MVSQLSENQTRTSEPVPVGALQINTKTNFIVKCEVILYEPPSSMGIASIEAAISLF